MKFCFTHWAQVTHICVNKLTISGLDNDFSLGRQSHYAGTFFLTNFSEILIEIYIFSFRKMHLKSRLEKRQPLRSSEETDDILFENISFVCSHYTIDVSTCLVDTERTWKIHVIQDLLPVSYFEIISTDIFEFFSICGTYDELFINLIYILLDKFQNMFVSELLVMKCFQIRCILWFLLIITYLQPFLYLFVYCQYMAYLPCIKYRIQSTAFQKLLIIVYKSKPQTTIFLP